LIITAAVAALTSPMATRLPFIEEDLRRAAIISGHSAPHAVIHRVRLATSSPLA
jgi:hypothetical protein